MQGVSGGGGVSSGGGEDLIRTLRVHGFAPTPTLNAFYVEFVKDYADDVGRRARALVQFEKPNGVGGELRLSGFTVIVQAAIEPTLEAVETRAPPVMRADLAALVEAFSVGMAPSSVVVRACESCGTPVNEFFIVDGRVTCRQCKTGESWDDP